MAATRKLRSETEQVSSISEQAAGEVAATVAQQARQTEQARQLNHVINDVHRGEMDKLKQELISVGNKTGPAIIDEVREEPTINNFNRLFRTLNATTRLPDKEKEEIAKTLEKEMLRHHLFTTLPAPVQRFLDYNFQRLDKLSSEIKEGTAKSMAEGTYKNQIFTELPESGQKFLNENYFQRNDYGRLREFARTCKDNGLDIEGFLYGKRNRTVDQLKNDLKGVEEIETDNVILSRVGSLSPEERRMLLNEISGEGRLAGVVPRRREE